MRKHNLIIYILIILFSIFLSGIPVPNVTAASPSSGSSSGSNMTVTFLDVGQGDAAVIQSSGKTLMIDGGRAKASSFVYSWLKNHNISYIDYMVATHPDADHIGGLAGALNYAQVGTAYCSRTSADTKTFQNFVKYLAEQGKSITVPEAGTSFSLGKAKVQILGPLSASDDDNNASIVLRIVYGKTSFLFTGDAEREEEEELLHSGYELQSTVLKVGHHGSDTSTSYLFLRTVDPQYAVISVGADNSYGHPTQEVLSRLRDADVTTYRTDMQGTITAVSDGKKITFSTEKNTTGNTLADAGAGQKSQTQTNNSSGTGQTGTGNTSAGKSSESFTRTYVLNTNTHKFHYPDCSSVSQMKEKNKKVVTKSRDQLISEGYSPCGRCNP